MSETHIAREHMNPIVGLLAGGRRRGSSDADQDGGGLLSRALATTYDRAGRKSPCSVSRALGDAENSILNCETQEKRCEIENGSRQEADQAAAEDDDEGCAPAIRTIGRCRCGHRGSSGLASCSYTVGQSSALRHVAEAKSRDGSHTISR